MGKTTISLIILILGLLIVSGCTTAKQPSAQQQDADNVINKGESDAAVEPLTGADDTSADGGDPEQGTSGTKTFVLTGENFKLKMDGKAAPELRVKEGDTVRIEFTSTNGFHDWVINEFDASTNRVQTGGSTFVEFVADKKGTFEYFCSVANHRQLGMAGKLIVE